MAASDVTTGSHHAFEHMVRTHRRSPTSLFLLCSLFIDALGLPHEDQLDFPPTREWDAAYREGFAAYAIRPRDILLRLLNRCLYVGPHFQEFWKASTLKGRNALLGEPSGTEVRWRQLTRCLLFQRRRQTRWGGRARRWRANC